MIMKKRLVSLMLVLVMSLGLVACGGTTEEAPAELTEVTWNYGTSGNVLVTIANEKGYFEAEGIKITPVEATANADAMALLASGKVNVVSNAGTSNPLQQIAQTSWINENPDTVKAIIRALLRAQSYYEANKEEAVTLHAAAIGATESYVGAYMMDDEHYFVSVDPLANGVTRAWGILEATGYIAEDCGIEIEDHINTALYEEALAEATELYGAEAPEFYEAQAAFFAENNK